MTRDAARLGWPAWRCILAMSLGRAKKLTSGCGCHGRHLRHGRIYSDEATPCNQPHVDEAGRASVVEGKRRSTSEEKCWLSGAALVCRLSCYLSSDSHEHMRMALKPKTVRDLKFL